MRAGGRRPTFVRRRACTLNSYTGSEKTETNSRNRRAVSECSPTTTSRSAEPPAPPNPRQRDRQRARTEAPQKQSYPPESALRSPPASHRHATIRSDGNHQHQRDPDQDRRPRLSTRSAHSAREQHRHDETSSGQPRAQPNPTERTTEPSAQATISSIGCPSHATTACTGYARSHRSSYP